MSTQCTGQTFFCQSRGVKSPGYCEGRGIDIAGKREYIRVKYTREAKI
jgi:hypothetical protein